MIKLNQIAQLEGDVVPQAIFTRSIFYFSSVCKRTKDDLDEFHYITFDIGNWLRFDLRHYDGHPESTATLYLPLSFNDPEDISYAISKVVRELRVPLFALAWQRGEQFEYGRLPRRADDRLREPEARLLVLKAAAGLPGREGSTDQLIERCARLFNPSPIDQRQSWTRRLQPRWHQIVRNVISHRNGQLSPFQLGHAVRTDGGLRVTENGIALLQSIGFLP